jgi:hypothetical protein
MPVSTPASPSEPVQGPTDMKVFAGLSAEEQQVLLKVAEILKRLQFGTVLLVVQDGKVVQIEMAEKFRLR